MEGKIYEFEDYVLDVAEHRLQKSGEDISLPPKVFEVLIALVKKHSQLVSYDELMNEVWKDTFVEETNLRYCIHSLRKVFNKEFIETVPKRGYRFNAEVRSYTAKEFIEKYAGNVDDKELFEEISLEEKPLSNNPETDISEKKEPVPFFTKPLGYISITLLMALIGFSAYYLWQNGQNPTDNKTTQITVLPFSIIGQDSGQKTEIQNGLLNSMIFDLTKIRGLKVTPRTEVNKFIGKQVEPLKIGKSFSSDMVLEGSYRFESEQTVRVNTRLLNVSNGETFITEAFTVKAEGQIKLEKIISLRIARKVFEKLAANEDEKFIKTQNISEESRKHYLIGQQILRNYEYDRREEGVGSFEKIIEAEPNWAKGYGKYAEALVLIHGGLPDWEKVKQVADKGLELDKNMPEAYLALGWYYQSKFDWENAENSFDRAIELNPEYAQAFLEYGILLDTQRKFAKAEKQIQTAINLKPFDPFFFTMLCTHYYYDKKWDLAIESCTTALNIDSDFDMPEKHLFWIYAETDDYETMFNNEYKHYSKSDIENNFFAQPLKDGNFELYWQRRIDDRLKNTKRRYSPLAISGFYAQLEDKENTLKYIEETAEKSPIDLIFIYPDPMFDFVRNEPRFIEVMNRANFSP